MAGLAVDTIARGLAVPWSLDFAPDGRIFLTERPGRIRVIENGALRPEPWAVLPVYGVEPGILPESGLMGIALAPDFATTGHVYVLGTFWKSGRGRAARAWNRISGRISELVSGTASTPWENRVYRITDRNGQGSEPEVIVDDLPANYYHAGGALAFGPDGLLYLGNGEALRSVLAQDTARLEGKVLRYRPDGSIPPDNPFPGSPVYAYGTRNTQALAWHPQTRALFGTDHGPSNLPHEDGRFASDELNLITPGANLGWPIVAGPGQDTAYQNPVVSWTPAIAPAGLAFYTGPHAPWQNNAFVGGLRGQQLRRIVLEAAPGRSPGWRAVVDEPLFQDVLGRLRAVRMGPDGFLYITTSNRDGRGIPAPEDDLLLRVRPVASAPARAEDRPR